jgi:nucleotide-binding universal stress UspA family protein
VAVPGGARNERRSGVLCRRPDEGSLRVVATGERAAVAESRAGRIVVGVDGSPGSRAALVWALDAAAATGDSVQVVATFPVEFYWADPNLMDERRIEAVRADTGARVRALVDEAMADRRTTGDVPVDVVVAAGRAAEQLVRSAEHADLLVVGSRGRGAVRSTVLGSVALHCVTHARGAVVVVHPRAAAPLRPPRVVVGLDGSDSSGSVLARALLETARIGGELTVVAAYSAATHWSDAYEALVPPVAELREDVRQRADRLVADALAALPPDGAPAVQVLPVEGAPGEVLVRQAEGAELLVVGGRGHGALRGVLLGSVALNCVIHGPCPVMVVRPGVAAATVG